MDGMGKREAVKRDDENIGGEDPGSKQGKRPSGRSRKMGRRTATGSFYAQSFTPEELAALASKADADDLGDEIGLLRILIRRKMAGAKADDDSGAGAEDDGEVKVDAESIRRFVSTLCQAVRIRYSLSGKGTRTLEEAAETVLAEIVGELGAPQCDREMKGVVVDGSEQRGSRPVEETHE